LDPLQGSGAMALTSGGTLFALLLLCLAAAIGLCCLCCLLCMWCRRRRRKQAAARGAVWLAAAPPGSKRLGGPTRDAEASGSGDQFDGPGARTGMLSTLSPAGAGASELEASSERGVAVLDPASELELEKNDLASLPLSSLDTSSAPKASSSKRSSMPTFGRSARPSVRLLPVNRVRSDSAPALKRDESFLVSSQI
jgi:hypothetical protein